LRDKVLDPRGGMGKLHIVGVFSVASLPCDTEFDISRKILAGCAVRREPLAPSVHRPFEPLEIPVPRHLAENAIHGGDHGR
jgi:hypothetical protein